MPTQMADATITFPMLGDWFSFSGSATYTLFGRTFYWYGAVIALGFLLTVAYCMPRCRRFGFTPDEIVDALIFGVPAGVLGARLYYVIFHFDTFAGNFWSIFRLWEGGLAIYGGIMNPATVIIFQPQPTAEMFWLAYLQGIPFDLVHAAATVTFMLLLSQPMLEKLDRIKVKYGLLE